LSAITLRVRHEFLRGKLNGMQYDEDKVPAISVKKIAKNIKNVN
jgi:hypothetical protein